MVGNTSNESATADVAERLQQLGLKEYEAKCFVALTALSSGTAREISKAVDVPRTRVYEAARALESHGLIHVQHSSPQRFRAVPIDEAVGILRNRYESRIDQLETELRAIETAEPGTEDEPTQEIWAITGRDAIATKTDQLLEDAEEQAVLVVTDDRVLSSPICEWLRTAREGDCSIAAGAVVESVREQLAEALSAATVFESELTWLCPGRFDGAPPVSFLLAVDREIALISASALTAGGSNHHAVYGTGQQNSMVVVLRELVKRGLSEEW